MIDRDKFCENLSANKNSIYYLVVVTIQSIIDRLSMLINIHFTFEMWEVKVKLESQTMEETTKAFKKIY
jgi:hypothetical protein